MSCWEDEAREIVLHCGGVVAGLLHVGHSTGPWILARSEQNGTVHYRRRVHIGFTTIDQLFHLPDRSRARSGAGRGKLGLRYGQRREQEGPSLRSKHTGGEEISAQEHSVRKRRYALDGDLRRREFAAGCVLLRGKGSGLYAGCDIEFNQSMRHLYLRALSRREAGFNDQRSAFSSGCREPGAGACSPVRSQPC